MIRINLLAKKTTKKKAGSLRHLVIGAVAMVILAVGLGWVWIDQRGKLAALRTQIAQQEAEKDRLKNVNEQKSGYEKEKGELERKLAIITRLQRERIVPVHLLDELTRVLDAATPVWITSYAFTSGGVSIDGYALSNEALRPLVDNLEKSAFHKNVELLFSERSELQGREAFRFSIKAGVQEPE